MLYVKSGNKHTALNINVLAIRQGTFQACNVQVERWEVIWWSSLCLSYHITMLQPCSKVVNSAPTHSTQCTPWYIAHSHSAYIDFYLPPTDYKCRYQRDVLGTGCWKTLKCRKRSNDNTTYYTDGIFCSKLILHCNVADLQGTFTATL